MTADFHERATARFRRVGSESNDNPPGGPEARPWRDAPRAGQRVRAVRNGFIFLVCVLGALFVGRFFAEKPILDPVKMETGEFERFWQLKVRGSQPVDMILLGDSRICRAVSPELLTAQLPGHDWRAVNLGFNFGGLNEEMFELAEARFDRESDRRALLLGVTPISLTGYSGRNRQYNILVQRSAFTARAYILFPRLMGILSRHDPPFIVRRYPGLQEYYDSGWMGVLREPADHRPKGNLKNYRRLFSDYPVDQRRVESLLHQVRRWTEAGIDVFGFRPPTHSALYALENESSGFDERAFVDEFERNGGAWIDIRHDRFYTYDGSHIPRGESVKLSRELGRRIGKLLES